MPFFRAGLADPGLNEQSLKLYFNREETIIRRPSSDVYAVGDIGTVSCDKERYTFRSNGGSVAIAVAIPSEELKRIAFTGILHLSAMFSSSGADYK